MTMVRREIAFFTAATSARQFSSTGTFIILMLKYCAALSKAAWAVTGTIISGLLMPRSTLARSRYDFMAMRMLSVPPEVTEPHDLPGARRTPAPSMAAVMDTISASNLVMLGHTSMWRGLDCELMA